MVTKTFKFERNFIIKYLTYKGTWVELTCTAFNVNVILETFHKTNICLNYNPD
jgi:hypothetical protein